MDSFTTLRLNATRLAIEDLPELIDLHLDPEVSRFLGGVRSAETTEAYVATNMRHWVDHKVGLWTLRSRDRAFVGRAGLRYVDVEGIVELEIAYTLARSAWGRGLATEIAAALVDHWRERRDDPSLVGLVMKGHVASERVLTKVGLDYERDAASHRGPCGVFRRRR